MHIATPHLTCPPVVIHICLSPRATVCVSLLPVSLPTSVSLFVCLLVFLSVLLFVSLLPMSLSLLGLPIAFLLAHLTQFSLFTLSILTHLSSCLYVCLFVYLSVRVINLVQGMPNQSHDSRRKRVGNYYNKCHYEWFSFTPRQKTVMAEASRDSDGKRRKKDNES